MGIVCTDRPQEPAILEYISLRRRGKAQQTGKKAISDGGKRPLTKTLKKEKVP